MWLFRGSKYTLGQLFTVKSERFVSRIRKCPRSYSVEWVYARRIYPISVPVFQPLFKPLFFKKNRKKISEPQKILKPAPLDGKKFVDIRVFFCRSSKTNQKPVLNLFFVISLKHGGAFQVHFLVSAKKKP